MRKYKFVPYLDQSYSVEEMMQKSESFYHFLDKRRSIRQFSDRSVPKSVIENLIKAASTAPSGAHKQPWTYCIVSDQVIKKKIREGAEEEEYENYHNRMPEEWLEDLKPLRTDWKKPFLETAPWLIVVFKRAYELVDGKRKRNYYVNESVGLSAGLLLAAIHHAGLVALTHTPSPMDFLTDILKRPDNERPFLLLPVGYPAEEATVPDLKRKQMSEVIVWHE